MREGARQVDRARPEEPAVPARETVAQGHDQAGPELYQGQLGRDLVREAPAERELDQEQPVEPVEQALA